MSEMIAPAGWRLWILAARPRTLPLSLGPVVVAAAYAWQKQGNLQWGALLAALLAAMAIQIGTNLWNDLGDGQRGADRADRLGPPRVTALGWVAPARVRQAALLVFAVAGVLGLWLVWLGGWPILVLGGLSLLCGWAYSHGPLPISHTPFSEMFVLAFFGVGAVLGTVWLQGVAPDGGGLVLGLVIGAPACAVLMVNNYRDAPQDRRAGRRTLALLAGDRWARWIYALLLLLPLLLLLLPTAPAGAWAGGLLFPLALRRIRDLWRTPRSCALNRVLAGTAQWQLWLGMVMAAGMVVRSL